MVGPDDTAQCMQSLHSQHVGVHKIAVTVFRRHMNYEMDASRHEQDSPLRAVIGHQRASADACQAWMRKLMFHGCNRAVRILDRAVILKTTPDERMRRGSYSLTSASVRLV
jgi:hypothetical protein